MEPIDRVHSRGAKINAYVNTRLARLVSNTYKKYGKDWEVLTKAAGLGVTEIEFTELHEEWVPNSYWEHPSEHWFTVLCPAVTAWQDHIVIERVRIIKEYHFDDLFVDQPGSYYAELCYNREHGHNNPTMAWGPGYLNLFQKIREAVMQVKPDCVIYTECMNDVYGQYLDYHMDKNPTFDPMKIHPEMETFVEIWRYMLPDQIIINNPWVYYYPPSKNQIYVHNCHFILGIREQWRLNVENEEHVKRQLVKAKIEHLWLKGRENLFYGRFMDNISLIVSTLDLLAKVHLGKDGISIPIWYTTE